MGSVLDIKETWKAGGGWQSEDGIKGSTQWVRTFTVTVSNTPTMCYAADVLSHRGIPKSGSSHPASPWFRCRSAKAKRVSPIMYEVECTYKSKTKDKEENPLEEPPEISYNTLSSTEEIDEDIDGNPINTKAGEPITGVKIPVGDLSATVTKNLASFDPSAIYTYTNTVNSAVFMGFAAGVVRMHNLQAKIVYTEDLTYWTVTAQFHFRYPVRVDADKAWWKRVRHEGTFALAGSDLVPTRITDGNGEIKGGKTMLKDDGTEETDTTIGHWLEFEVFRTIDLNGMGLGV